MHLTEFVKLSPSAYRSTLAGASTPRVSLHAHCYRALLMLPLRPFSPHLAEALHGEHEDLDLRCSSFLKIPLFREMT